MTRFSALLIGSFFLFVFTLFCTISNDFTQDLGRHIKLGEIIVKTLHVPTTNLFSYTNPAFPFFNHHWLTEVIFYGIASTIGVIFLNILKILLITGAIGFAVKAAAKKATTVIAIISGTLFAPLLLERTDIRPEMFGFFFFSVLLYLFSNKHALKKYWFIVPFVYLLWVNIHISFIFGVFLLFIYTAKHRMEQRLVFFTSLCALLINPHFITGAVYPLLIFKNYGYMIVENQNIFYLNSFGSNPMIHYFFFLSPLVIATLATLLLRKLYWETLTLIVLYILSFYQIRHLPFFVLAAIPFSAQAFAGYDYKKLLPKKYFPYLFGSFVVILLVLSVFNMNGWFYKNFDRDKQFGVTVHDPYKEMIAFVLNNKLPNNIFNNFDIGGYLIYRLYPHYKVFVDNRPEAYPAVFFQQTYIPLQLYEKQREKIFTENNIKTVIMAHTDQTDWGKSIIASLYKDTLWTLIFIDARTIIFTRDTKLPDARVTIDYFEKLISRQNDYLSLLHLRQFFSIIGENTLAEKSFQKALVINPSSCTINRILANRFANSPRFDEADSIKKSKWYCF